MRLLVLFVFAIACFLGLASDSQAGPLRDFREANKERRAERRAKRHSGGCSSSVIQTSKMVVRSAYSASPCANGQCPAPQRRRLFGN